MISISACRLRTTSDTSHSWTRLIRKWSFKTCLRTFSIAVSRVRRPKATNLQKNWRSSLTKTKIPGASTPSLQESSYDKVANLAPILEAILWSRKLSSKYMTTLSTNFAPPIQQHLYFQRQPLQRVFSNRRSSEALVAYPSLLTSTRWQAFPYGGALSHSLECLVGETSTMRNW